MANVIRGPLAILESGAWSPKPEQNSGQLRPFWCTMGLSSWLQPQSQLVVVSPMVAQAHGRGRGTPTPPLGVLRNYPFDKPRGQSRRIGNTPTPIETPNATPINVKPVPRLSGGNVNQPALNPAMPPSTANRQTPQMALMR